MLIFPILRGRSTEYLLKALTAYQKQERYDPYMSQLEFLSEADLQGLPTTTAACRPRPEASYERRVSRSFRAE